MPNKRITSSMDALSSTGGELYAVVCEGGATSGTVTVYDSVTQSGTIMTAPPVPANSTVPLAFNRLNFSYGLSVSISGGVTAVTLEWW